ncbi:ScbA/BarX family gamma-butyrolactone biosynthesis protein [Streptomyces sp. NPDC054794]
MSAITFQGERIPAHRVSGEGASVAPLTATVFPYPSLTTTVPKEFVHRAAVAEVMLTSWTRENDTHFTVTAQWPRAHSFFTPTEEGLHDPLIAAETIRQVGSLLAHAEYEVPLGHHFLMSRLEVSVEPTQLLVGDTPASVDLAITCTEVKRRGGGLARLDYEATILREGLPVARGAASFSTANPAVYRRVRGRQDLDGIRPMPLAAPAPPQHVGRTSPLDVVLSPTDEPDRWRLRVDTRHPILFDHPVDHVPGMVLLEAARQSATALLERSCFLPLSFTSAFRRYVELDAPCMIEARRQPVATDGTESVLVTGRQNEHEVFECVVTADAAPDFTESTTAARRTPAGALTA